jgi:YD repeat-containing protein
MLTFWLLLGCTDPAAPLAPGSERAEDASARAGSASPRIDATLRPPTLAEGAWHGPEPSAGRCRIYDGDGGLLVSTSLDADGRPIVRANASGGEARWYRWRASDGTVRVQRVYAFDRHAGYLDWFIEERLDAVGRVQSRSSGSDFRYWQYDDEGHIVKWSYQPEYGGASAEYEYDESGRVLEIFEARCCDPHRETTRTEYEWDGPRLVGETQSGDSGWHGVRWVRHHPTGLPELGEIWRGSDPQPVWLVEWTYDEAGRPVAYQDGGWNGRKWYWSGDRLIREEHIDGSTNLVYDSWDWTWDAEGRLIEEIRDGAVVSRWEWDADGNYLGGIEAGEVRTAQGWCPPRIVAPTWHDDVVPSPLPRAPAAPVPYGEAE